MLPPVVAPGGLAVEAVFGLFPNLRERLRSQGTKLSGGEQQMLAIGRILRTGARLLLLDEPTEGLAPVIVQQIGATIRRLKLEGFTILLVEQNFRFAATVADRHYVMEHGLVVDMIANAELDRPMASCTATGLSHSQPAGKEHIMSSFAVCRRPRRLQADGARSASPDGIIKIGCERP